MVGTIPNAHTRAEISKIQTTV